MRCAFNKTEEADPTEQWSAMLAQDKKEAELVAAAEKGACVGR